MSMNDQDLQASLEASLDRHKVAGASIALLRDGRVLTAAAGLANVSSGVTLTTDTAMHIGSITKVFNATLVMQLVDEGKIDLNERVARYLPELRLKDADALDTITVRMLLNHTSGIDGDALPDYGHDRETIEQGVARFAELGQIHAPGAEYSYCNAATVIAGYLAQRLSGKSWYQLVRERIFEPLDLRHAAALPEEALLHRASVGHYYDPGTEQLMRTSFAFLPMSFSPAGTTLMMSARDLLTFAQAHMAGGLGPNGARILSEPSAAAMQRITVDHHAYRSYALTDAIGLGWMLYDGGILFHGGGGPGIISMLYASPARDFAVAFLTNAAHGLNVINELAEPWLAQVGLSCPFGMTDIELPQAPIRIDTRKYVGTFENNLLQYCISAEGDALSISTQAKLACYDYISTEPTPDVRLVALGDDQFLIAPEGEGDALSTLRMDSARGGAERLSGGLRIIKFQTEAADGRMAFLGSGVRLNRRIG